MSVPPDELIYGPSETPEGYEERQRRIRLIKAAPDMLEALKMVDRPWLDEKIGQEAAIAVRCAITKAEGRS
jgi:hypothetical protein